MSSLTAEYMALFRALESSRPAASRLFTDPYAPLFLHEWRRWFYRLARVDFGRRFVEGVLDRGAPGARAAGMARTKWIDDAVTAAMEHATQLVVLGAGFDTRGYRLSSPARATVYELDQPDTSAAKQAALKQAGPLPAHVRFVAIDFNTQSLHDRLLQAGFDGTQPACFIWEGVTHYLTAEAVDIAFRQIRQAAPGSLLLFTYIDRSVLETPDRFFAAPRMLARLKAYGEPWKFGIAPEELEHYLADRGFRLLEDQSVADVWKRAGRPASGTHGYEFYRVASARAERECRR